MYVLNAVQMRQVDENTIEKLGIPQDVLMERAALAVADCVAKYNPEKVLCVCGSGNNGGDAVATARILKMRGFLADVFMCSPQNKWKTSVVKQYEIFNKVDGRTVTSMDFSEYDIIVDGIFGIGIDRNIEGYYAEVIRAVNEAGNKGAKIIAADIPSGIHTDKGCVLGVAVKADETIAFAYYKPGHLLYPGAEYCGKISVVDIGIAHKYFYEEKSLEMFTQSPDEPVELNKRERDGNKGTFGRVLVIAGSRDMYGACYLSALAALRTGVGLVDIFTHEINRTVIQTMLPEAILHVYKETFDKEELLMLMNQASCVVIGPGLSVSQCAMDMTVTVLECCEKNIVADADALNCIAKNKDLLYNQKRFPNRKLIITPHPGELSRLTGRTVLELKSDYLEIVRTFAKENDLIVIGKGAGTIVSDGERIYINQTGNEGMATAGSGDVLAGIIGALCAQKQEAFEAAWKGVFLHGKAGDYTLEMSNARSLIAGDLAGALQYVIKESVF